MSVEEEKQPFTFTGSSPALSTPPVVVYFFTLFIIPLLISERLKRPDINLSLSAWIFCFLSISVWSQGVINPSLERVTENVSGGVITRELTRFVGSFFVAGMNAAT